MQIDGAVIVRAALLRSAEVKRQAAGSDRCVGALCRIAETLVETFRAGNKVLLCGNGGSAADAQHVATELVVRLSKRRERRALAAIALTTDTSLLTACANDYSFDQIFARQVEALGAPGDALIGISTSGRSPNVIEAFRVARKRGLRCLFFGGGDGGPLLAASDHGFVVPCEETSHIQETHLAAYHAMCELVEARLFD